LKFTKGVTGTATIKKPCHWKCIYCNKMNSRFAVISASAYQDYEVFGRSPNEIMTLAKNNATAKLEEELPQVIRNVNIEHRFSESIILDGKCDSCGKKQPWTILYSAHSRLRMIIYVAIGIVMLLLAVKVIPSLFRIDLSTGSSVFSLIYLIFCFIAFLFISNVVYKGIKKLIESIVQKIINQHGDDYWPKITEEKRLKNSVGRNNSPSLERPRVSEKSIKIFAACNKFPSVERSQVSEKRIKYFADCYNVKLLRNVVVYEDLGWLGSYKRIAITVNPFIHRYIKIIDSYEVFNSHGTDTAESYVEIDIPFDEAYELIKENNSHDATNLKAFEESCNRALEECSNLIKQEYPNCEPIEMLYNSSNSTLIKVRDSVAGECVIKFTRMHEDRYNSIMSFLDHLKNRGGSRHIIELKEIIKLPFNDTDEFNNECIVIYKMPFCRPAYIPFYKETGFGVNLVYDKPKYCKKSYNYDCGLGVANALTDLHKLGYVHHDVRPENILIDPSGNVILGDIDSVGLINDQYKGHYRDSSRYRAPEMREHQPFGPDIDNYAWGLSMIHTLLFAPIESNVSYILNLRAIGNDVIHLECEGLYKSPCKAYYYKKDGDGNFDLVKAAFKSLSISPKERPRTGRILVSELTHNSTQNK